METHATKEWVRQAPYTVMLRDYQTAADLLRRKIAVLRQELCRVESAKCGTLASAQLQKQLEQRIMLLRTEYYEITDIIREIGPYAAREVQ